MELYINNENTNISNSYLKQLNEIKEIQKNYSDLIELQNKKQNEKKAELKKIKEELKKIDTTKKKHKDKRDEIVKNKLFDLMTSQNLSQDDFLKIKSLLEEIKINREKEDKEDKEERKINNLFKQEKNEEENLKINLNRIENDEFNL